MSGSNRTKSNPSFYLSQDEIIEVLLKLPVKSLVRFTMVCKNWHELIKSPYFISKHLKQYTLNPNLDMSFMLVITYDGDTHRYIMWSHKIDKSPDNKPIKLKFPFLEENINLGIVGVWNGLVCISLSMDEFNIVICNLATMKFHRVPNCGFWINGCIDNGEVLLGFMYDPSSDDYKLIKMIYHLDNLVDHAEIYTMSTNSWREIDIKIPFLADVNTRAAIPSATIDGVFYWEGQKGQLDDMVVLSFDTSNEAFRVIEGPMCYCGMWNDLEWDFIQLKEEIAIIIYSGKRSFDVWVLNENGSCWIKKFKIGPLPTIGTHPMVGGIGKFDVRGCEKNGNFVIQDRTLGEIKLLSYDSRSQEMKFLPFARGSSFYTMYLYIDSLLPVQNTI